MSSSRARRIVVILADAPLELAPDWLVRELKRRTGRKPKRRLLDAFYYGPVMSLLDNAEKRGRPDIVHGALLLLQDSELNARGFLRVYIHTIDERVISVAPHCRPPRHYLRFAGLMEQLLELGRVPPSGEPLMELVNSRLEDVVSSLRPCIVVGFSRRGRRVNFFDFARELVARHETIVNVVGAFAKGFFSSGVARLLDVLVSIADRGLSTTYALARIISAYELALGLI